MGKTKSLTKRRIVGTLPSEAKASVLNVVQSGQLSRLSPIMWTTLELRRQKVSTNFHLLTDVARQIWTTAYYTSIDQDGHYSVFAKYDPNTQEWIPDGTMKMSEQGMFYNRMLCADLVRTLKELGFLDVIKRPDVKYEYELPLSYAPGNVKQDFIYEQKFDAIQQLVDISPLVVPLFLKPYRIGKQKYARIVQYVHQCLFIKTHWDDILEQTNWQQWAVVSDEYKEHAGDMSVEFRRIIGLF